MQPYIATMQWELYESSEQREGQEGRRPSRIEGFIKSQINRIIKNS